MLFQLSKGANRHITLKMELTDSYSLKWRVLTPTTSLHTELSITTFTIWTEYIFVFQTWDSILSKSILAHDILQITGRFIQIVINVWAQDLVCIFDICCIKCIRFMDKTYLAADLYYIRFVVVFPHNLILSKTRQCPVGFS